MSRNISLSPVLFDRDYFSFTILPLFFNDFLPLSYYVVKIFLYVVVFITHVRSFTVCGQSQCLLYTRSFFRRNLFSLSYLFSLSSTLRDGERESTTHLFLRHILLVIARMAFAVLAQKEKYLGQI